MNSPNLRILAIGAHPDDCELTTGGACLLYASHGHTVKYVSMTNGDAGHHLLQGKALSDRRADEFAASCAIGGFEHEILDNHDGYLAPNHENRDRLIRLIRRFQPDLIFLPRTNDYHPDHRATGQLVQDTAYLLMVPNICPDTPALEYNPVMMHVADRFQKPVPFEPSIAIDIDAVHATKIRMVDCHVSQFYEWLPWVDRIGSTVPADPMARIPWLSQLLDLWEGDVATRFRSLIISRYGADRAAGIRHAEVFECCEYGGSLTEEHLAALFPF